MSSIWIKKYETFLLYDQFDKGVPENQLKYNAKNHFTKLHPGPITNVKDLCEEDKGQENIYGTGTLKGMEAEFLD